MADWLCTAEGNSTLRFFCDEMLHGLGRWLRAAGYDTAIAAGGLPDRVLAARCAKEDRVLLTKDRHLAAIVTGTAPVVLVRGSGDGGAVWGEHGQRCQVVAALAGERQRGGQADGRLETTAAESEREWLLTRIAEKPELTLRAVVAELAERGSEAEIVVERNSL